MNEKLERIKAACRTAIELGGKGTPAPWGTEETSATAWVGPMRTNGDGKIAVIVCGLPINDDLKPEYSARNLTDAHLIAHARTFSPAAAQALLTVIEALEFFNFEATLKQICNQWEELK